MLDESGGPRIVQPRSAYNAEGISLVIFLENCMNLFPFALFESKRGEEQDVSQLKRLFGKKVLERGGGKLKIHRAGRRRFSQNPMLV